MHAGNRLSHEAPLAAALAAVHKCGLSDAPAVHCHSEAPVHAVSMVEGEYEPAPAVFYRPPALEDLDRIHELEAAGYPPDEAASRERLRYRLQHANGQFLAAVQPGEGESLQILGFVCGTLSSADKLTHESMGVHEPEGDLLAIHSVCVDAAHRRRGVATRLLRAFLAYAQGTTPQLREMRLICKEQLIPLYQGAGFEMVGPSDVVHGKDPWFEMRWAPDGSSSEGEAGEQQIGAAREVAAAGEEA